MVYSAESPEYIQDGKYFYPSDPLIPGTNFRQGMDLKKPYAHIKGLGSLTKPDVHKSFFNESTRRLIQITPEDMDRARELAEDIEKRKELLVNRQVLTNPYNFKDL